MIPIGYNTWKFNKEFLRPIKYWKKRTENYIFSDNELDVLTLSITDEL